MTQRTKTKSETQLQDAAATPSLNLKILIMNVNGPTDGKGTADRRKKTIHDIIETEDPNLILFQEFSWKSVAGKTWAKYPISEKYQLSGNAEASVLFDTNELLISEYSVTLMQKMLDEMKRKNGDIPTDFTPLPRMCARIVETKGAPNIKFICISWHGRYSRLSEAQMIREFKNAVKFFREIFTREKLPIMIGGDFNIKITKAKACDVSPFKIYDYIPLDRRNGNVIDFYMSTENQILKEIKALELSKLSKAERPFTILDHDPVKALLCLSSVQRRGKGYYC